MSILKGPIPTTHYYYIVYSNYLMDLFITQKQPSVIIPLLWPHCIHYPFRYLPRYPIFPSLSTLEFICGGVRDHQWRLILGSSIYFSMIMLPSPLPMLRDIGCDFPTTTMAKELRPIHYA